MRATGRDPSPGGAGPHEGCIRHPTLDSLARRRWAWSSPPYRGLQLGFGVRTTDGGLGDHLERVLAPLQTTTENEAPAVVSVIDTGDDEAASGRRFDIYVGDEWRDTTTDTSEVVRLVVAEINHAAVAASAANHVLLHASAAAHRGRAAIFPAPPGAGKTTLVAGLLLRGVDYVTDEVVAIDRMTGAVLPYPKPLSLKRGAWTILPELEPPPGDPWLDDQWHVDPSRAGAKAVADVSTPAFVIAPRYERNATTTLEPMRRSDALVTLMNHAFTENERGRDGFRTLAAIARATSCFRLTVDDLDDACALVLDLFESVE